VDELQDITNRKILIFTDCQAAITTAFSFEIPTRNIEIILNIKLKLKNIEVQGNTVEIHWIPGHKNIQGNELADQQAKLAATEIMTSKTDNQCYEKKDAKEVINLKGLSTRFWHVLKHVIKCSILINSNI